MAIPDRWAPWSEQVLQVANLTVTGTSPVAVPSASVTLVPHIDTRLSFVIDADIECTGFAAGSLLNVRPTLNGVASVRDLVFLPTAAGIRLQLGAAGFWNLTKETSYTIALEALLFGAGGTYVVRGAGLLLTALPNLHS